MSNAIAEHDKLLAVEIDPTLALVIQSIIHDGTNFDAACKKHNLNPYNAISQLNAPHVRQFIREQSKVRLVRARLSNVHHLERIRKGSTAAAVSAIRLIEEMSNEGVNSATSANITPGVTINIISSQPQAGEGQHVQPMVIEHEPAIDQAGLVDRPSSQAKKSSVKKAGGKVRSKPARS